MTSGTTVKKKKKHGFFKFIFFSVLIISAFMLWKKHSFYDFTNISLFSSEKTVSASANLNTYDSYADKSGYGMGTGDIEILDQLNALAKEDNRINQIINNIDAYPESLLKLLVKNDEARDFVLEYPEHLNDKTTGEIDRSELNSGIPHFLQWDERWGYHNYGSGVLGVTGCGPTCLSMVIVALTDDKDATPAALADYSAQNGFYVEGAGTSWELMSAAAEDFGLTSAVIPLSEDSMIAELEAGHPLIVNVGPGDFTNYGHFIVITDYENGMFKVNDPNSIRLSSEGWYYSTLEPQIKNIWAFSNS